jgi:hypothetical protein
MLGQARGGPIGGGSCNRPTIRAPGPTRHAWRLEHPMNDCLNCGAALHGAFCSRCGQRSVPANPTVSELAVILIWATLF